MQVVRKVLSSIKKDGIFKTIRKIFRYIKYKFLLRKKDICLLKDYVDINQFETIIVFENNFGWNKIMKQRPQQIANSLPEKTLMFYHSHEDGDYYNNTKRIHKLKDNLILIDLGYYRDSLFEELSSHNNKYLMIYSTDYIPYDRIKLYEEYGYDIIYEFVDDFNVKLSGKDMYKILTERHRKLIKDDPIVICTANKLYEDASKKFKYTKMVTNGVDYDHFKPAEYQIPKDLMNIRKKYKTLICYYGALASWFDYDLIKKVAANKDYGIVLLGLDYDQTLEKSGILDCNNVFYLGKKQYDELPSYGSYMDLFVIPFLINNITKATSPVKIFEYMAMEKPIITTALPECQKYKSVLYSNSHEEFISNLKKGIKLIDNAKYKKLLLKEATDNTWESKAKTIVKFANSTHYGKLDSEITKILAKSDYDRVVVWRSPFGWNVPLFQRPQHISMQLSKQKSLVFYEVTPNTDYVKTIKKLKDNLYLVNFTNYYVKDILKKRLKALDKPKYLQIYSTNWSMSVSELKDYKKDGFKVLYEYIDDISPELAGTHEIPQYILDKYKYAIKNKDVLIVTTAKALYNDIVKKRGEENMVFSCNGVDYNFFQKLDDKFEFEHEFTSIINNGKVNLCYYGALASWFDYDLIKKINSTNKYNIILFGIKYDDAYDNSGINQLKNVHFLGPRDYKVLKNYASKVDILTIPFVINSITQATSPLKLFEYMALHKPIITTAMDECKNYKSVLVANNHEEYLNLLKKCKKLSKDKAYQNLLIKEGKDNDWKNKAKIITELFIENERK